MAAQLTPVFSKPVHLTPQVPAGEALAQWTIRAFERACADFRHAYDLPPSARQLTAERIAFRDLATITEIERSERAPQDLLLYQILRHAGVPEDYLDTTYAPLLTPVPGIGVHWSPLAEQPVLYADETYLTAGFSAADPFDRLCSAWQFGENLIRVGLAMLPLAQPVPPQHQAQVRECFRGHLTGAFADIKGRFPTVVRARDLQQGFQLFSDLLNSDEAIYSMHGARLLLRFTGRNVLATEDELGQDLQTGVVYILGEHIRSRFHDLLARAFLRRLRPDANRERRSHTIQWSALRLLDELHLGAVRELYQVYVHSELPLHYWAATSKRINPWSYPL